jgi:integrase
MRRAENMARISELGPLPAVKPCDRPQSKFAEYASEPCGHKFGGHCPQRVPLRTETAGTKSKAGKRGIGLPDELVALLKHHKAEQECERRTAAELW